jgi:formate hydrogenlyase subunit 6/NADH:ubiquinone oxidoreductase subunit I
MASPFLKWFRDIAEGMISTGKGMFVTAKHVFRDPVTVEYPDIDVRARLPERYRGILHVEMEICISCHLCENACPINCILIEDVKGTRTTVQSKTTGKPSPKVKYPTRFDIDISKCMFCGLCVEPCPTGAIRHTTAFEGTVSNVADLTFHYVSPADLELARKQEELYEAQKAAAAATPATGEEKPNG